MGITFLQSNNAEDQAAAGTCNSTFTSPPAVGNLIVVATYAQAANPVTTVVDDMGNLYTKIVSRTIDSADLGNATIELWYAWNISVAGSHKVTFNSGAGHNSGIVIHEFSGAKSTSDPLDGSGGGSNQNTPPTMQASVTVTGTADLLFGWGIAETFRGSVLGNGATLTPVFNGDIDASTGWLGMSEYKILTTSGAGKVADWNNTSGTLAWLALASGFVAAPSSSSNVIGCRNLWKSSLR